VTAGLRLAVNVVAMLLVFYALMFMLDAAVSWGAGLCGRPDLTFSRLYAYAFRPFAWLMGVPWNDGLAVGELLGTKTLFNEFLGYERLTGMMASGEIGARSAILSTYALCGFANFMSIGVQIGGLSQLAPERRADFSRVAFRAMVAGSLACQLTACVVGVVGEF
jgi:CNT family concentrative nucleoside transporter